MPNEKIDLSVEKREFNFVESIARDVVSIVDSDANKEYLVKAGDEVISYHSSAKDAIEEKSRIENAK